MTDSLSKPRPAPWIAAQATQLLQQRGHAWLLYGPSGLGQFPLALELASAWLCETQDSRGACGKCTSCHAVQVHTHADLCVLMPETILLQHGWPLSEKAQAEIDEKKRKPSREIRVDAMRDAVEFSQRTSARGRGKVVLVFPAEQMNTITANALLKTLEEPPGDVKFVLATESVHQLLPTIRSRCLGHAMAWPVAAAGQHWLEAHGVPPAQSALWLRTAGGRPDDALEGFAEGRDIATWSQVVQALVRGEAAFFKDWSMARLINTLQMVCHDAMLLQAGAPSRFFAEGGWPVRTSWVGLSGWSQALMASRRTMDHPYNTGLMVEALVAQAKTALNSRD